MDDTSLEIKNKRLLEIWAEKDREIERLSKLEDKFWILMPVNRTHIRTRCV